MSARAQQCNSSPCFLWGILRKDRHAAGTSQPGSVLLQVSLSSCQLGFPRRVQWLSTRCCPAAPSVNPQGELPCSGLFVVIFPQQTGGTCARRLSCTSAQPRTPQRNAPRVLPSLGLSSCSGTNPPGVPRESSTGGEVPGAPRCWGRPCCCWHCWLLGPAVPAVP